MTAELCWACSAYEISRLNLKVRHVRFLGIAELAINRPAADASQEVRTTRLTRERSKAYRGAQKVKNFVESWHLGPQIGMHHPKDGGDGERGSHSRYQTRQ